MTAIFRAQGSNSTRAAIRIEWVGLSSLISVIHITDRNLVVLLHTVMNRFIREEESPFAMCNPNTKGGSFHSLEHDSFARVNSDTAETAFKLATVIVEETRLFVLRQSILARDPSQECHELASIADSKAEGVLSLAEVFELLVDILVELDHSSPALATIKDICKRETSYKDNTTELVQSHSTCEQITHSYIPGIKASSQESSDHFSVSIATLLAENSNLVLSHRLHYLLISRYRFIGEFPLWCLSGLQTFFFLDDTFRIALSVLQLEACCFPDIA
mmetsp:Transcript_28229/g.46809  ORF Transcript_28229/g.46809 Transcript_28229/m.46809 type:complete len:275 (-) Transcript_28229:62-886(-)